MKTILTIDFDIIMNPSIQLYNNMVSMPWEDRLKCYPVLQNLIIDFNFYSKITDYLLTLFKKVPKNKVHFVMDHHKIVNYCLDNETYNIINVDHHHDYAYKPTDIDNQINELDCGNWLKYLIEKTSVKSYCWIHGDNAIGPVNSVIKNIPQYRHERLIPFNLMALPTPDEIIICLSPPWVPPYLHSLYYTWMDIANAIYNTHFEIEG